MCAVRMRSAMRRISSRPAPLQQAGGGLFGLRRVMSTAQQRVTVKLARWAVPTLPDLLTPAAQIFVVTTVDIDDARRRQFDDARRQ